MNDQTANLLEFGKLGLIFNYDLLGYGVMAFSTFFTGLTMKLKNKMDKWLGVLLMIPGSEKMKYGTYYLATNSSLFIHKQGRLYFP